MRSSWLDRELAGLLFNLPARSATSVGYFTASVVQTSLATHLPAVFPLAGVDPVIGMVLCSARGGDPVVGMVLCTARGVDPVGGMVPRTVHGVDPVGGMWV